MRCQGSATLLTANSFLIGAKLASIEVGLRYSGSSYSQLGPVPQHACQFSQQTARPWQVHCGPCPVSRQPFLQTCLTARLPCTRRVSGAICTCIRTVVRADFVDCVNRSRGSLSSSILISSGFSFIRLALCRQINL